MLPQCFCSELCGCNRVTDTQEPLDGIFGFSQGANMASLLAAQATAGAGAEDAHGRKG